MSPRVLLFTRVGCHLCDDAKALLVRHGLAVTEIDIDTQPDLQARYDTCVPVVTIDGKERFRGRVDEVLLRRLLRARGRDPQHSDRPPDRPGPAEPPAGPTAP